MKVSKKLLSFLCLMQIIAICNQTNAHMVYQLGVANEIRTKPEFKKALTSQYPTAIMLKMDNCVHCKVLLPKFQESATLPVNKNIDFYIVNGVTLQAAKTINELTNGDIKIPGYPSIVFINNGKIIDYQIGGNPKTMLEKIKALAKIS